MSKYIEPFVIFPPFHSVIIHARVVPVLLVGGIFVPSGISISPAIVPVGEYKVFDTSFVVPSTLIVLIQLNIIS